MALKHIFAVWLIALLAGNVSARAHEAGNSEKVAPALRTFTLTEDKVRTFGAYTAVVLFKAIGARNEEPDRIPCALRH